MTMTLKLTPTLAFIAAILLLLVSPVPIASTTNPANLQVTKANSVGGSTTVGTSWIWTITLKNIVGPSEPSTFNNGEVIFRDELPNANISYGAPALGNFSGTFTNPGNIACAIVTNVLTCTASGGSVSFVSNASVDVTFTATATAAGTFSNPRVGGECKIDPGGVASENPPTDNDCNDGTADTVTVTGGGGPDGSFDNSGSPSTYSGGEPYYVNGFYGHVFVDDGGGVANGGNHFQGNVAIYSVGNMICMVVPPGYEATTDICVTNAGGGRQDFGIRKIEDSGTGTNGAGSTSGAAVTGFLIGPGGGEFGCSNAIISVPAGAVLGDTFFLCDADEEATSGQSAFGYSLIGPRIEVLTDTGQSTFSPPLTICLPFGDADVLQAGGDVLNFVVGFFDGLLLQWQPLPVVESTVEGLACGATDHFTAFGLLARVPTQLPATGASGAPAVWWLAFAALLAAGAGLFVWKRRTTTRADAP